MHSIFLLSLMNSLITISTFFVLTGILFTNLDMYPINIFMHSIGVFGWTISGFLMKDKAILTNFG